MERRWRSAFSSDAVHCDSTFRWADCWAFFGRIYFNFVLRCRSVVWLGTACMPHEGMQQCSVACGEARCADPEHATSTALLPDFSRGFTGEARGPLPLITFVVPSGGAGWPSGIPARNRAEGIYRAIRIPFSAKDYRTVCYRYCGLSRAHTLCSLAVDFDGACVSRLYPGLCSPLSAVTCWWRRFRTPHRSCNLLA